MWQLEHAREDGECISRRLRCLTPPIANLERRHFRLFIQKCVVIIVSVAVSVAVVVTVVVVAFAAIFAAIVARRHCRRRRFRRPLVSIVGSSKFMHINVNACILARGSARESNCFPCSLPTETGTRVPCYCHRGGIAAAQYLEDGWLSMVENSRPRMCFWGPLEYQSTFTFAVLRYMEDHYWSVAGEQL